MQVRALIIFFLLILFNSASLARTIQAGVMKSEPISIVAEWPVDENTQAGEHFSARIVEDVVNAAGEVLIPKNSRVIGRIVEINNAKSFNRDGRVDINFEKILFPDNVQSISINADGSMIKNETSLLAKTGAIATELGTSAALGALAGLKFGGIIGTGTSSASNMAIGAMTGASLSLISFISKKGQEVEINPGLPMMLNLLSMNDDSYKEQKLAVDTSSGVQAYIVDYKNDKIAVEIDNALRHSIPLSNIKIVDALGYTVKPNMAFAYHDAKAIPAKSNSLYEFEFNPSNKNSRYWLVLTDSFNKQEYFRKEIK